MEKEIVICAALIAKDGTIIRCHRHMHGRVASYQMDKQTERDVSACGFITSRNRYVDSKEALTIQKEAGIKSIRGAYLSDIALSSEDVY